MIEPSAGARRLLVTRPAAQAASALRELHEAGVDAQALPLIGIAALTDTTPLRALWAGLDRWHLLVFVSQNAVTHFFAARPAGTAWPAGLIAAAPGPGTAAALREAGVPAALVVAPAADGRQDSEALWAALAVRREWLGARVLILRGADASAPPLDAGVGREWLASALSVAGAEVRLQAVYRRGPADLSAAERALLDAALAAPARHVWLLASAEAVDHLQALVAQGGQPWPAPCGAAIATHPRIAERARAAGFAPVLLSAGDAASVAACLAGASIEFQSS